MQQLNLVESRLFERYRSGACDGRADCQSGCLPWPEAIFECFEGRVYFFFSGKTRKYVFTDFVLNGGGTGGYLVSCATEGVAGSCVSCPSPVWDDRKVARADLGVALVARYIASARGQAPIGLGGWPSWRSPAFGGTGSAFGVEDLAEWSLLGRMVTVREQLASPYARAILAGELVCRVGAQVASWHVGDDGAGFDGTARGGFFTCDAELLAESELVIHAFEGRRTNRPGGYLKYFFTSALMDPDCLGDDRRLGLIKSEFILRMSHAVSRRVDEAEASFGRGLEGGAADRGRVFRKLSLLGDVVRLCRSFFGASAADGFDVEDLAEGMILMVALPDSGSDVRGFMLELDEFGRLTDALAEALATDFGNDEDPLDRMKLQGRLISLATDILDGR